MYLQVPQIICCPHTKSITVNCIAKAPSTKASANNFYIGLGDLENSNLLKNQPLKKYHFEEHITCIIHHMIDDINYKKWTAVMNFISFVDVVIHRESMEFEKETGLSMWDTLPDDIILHVFSFLSPFSVVRMSETCRYSCLFVFSSYWIQIWS